MLSHDNAHRAARRQETPWLGRRITSFRHPEVELGRQQRIARVVLDPHGPPDRGFEINRGGRLNEAVGFALGIAQHVRGVARRPAVIMVQEPFTRRQQRRPGIVD
jgi:hypothetical protein